MAPPSARRTRPGSVGFDRSGQGSGAYIVGLADFQKELRKLTTADERKWNLELGRAFRPIARDAQRHAQEAARSNGGPQGHFYKAIRGSATAREVRLQIKDSRAYAAFWGAKQSHTGWNAGNNGKPNQPSWVGNTWSVGGIGGPYVLNESIADNLDSYIDRIWGAIDSVMGEAFPD